MRWLVVLILSATGVRAEPWIDYDLFLQQNADKVVAETAPDGSVTRHLDMGNGVIVTCTANGCVGTDKSPEGALGCTFAILLELQAVVQACDGILTPEKQSAFDQLYQKLGGFVAANAVPPRSWKALAEDLQGQISAPKANYTAEACKQAAAPGSDIRRFFDTFTAPKALSDLDALLATRRLPVINPCL